MVKRIAVLLFNLGGPSSPAAVRPFLFRLFYDKRIIQLPNPLRFLLAYWIAKRREKKATVIYDQIGGKSPILPITLSQAQKLESVLNNEKGEFTSEIDYKTFVIMRYSSPLANDVILDVISYNPDKVILLPLYPQYSTTTTLSALENWLNIAKCHNFHPETEAHCCYYYNRNYIAAHVALIKSEYEKAIAHKKVRILFSAHGLPESVIANGDPYEMHITKNVELIVENLKITHLDWVICYQSKVGRAKWLQPNTESELLKAQKEGIAVVVVPIAFVSDHSETLVELDIEYKHLYANDDKYFRVPALNCDDRFIDCLKELCLNGPALTPQCGVDYKMCYHLCKKEV